MSADNQGGITQQVDSRLNELFGEDGIPSEPIHAQQADEATDAMDEEATDADLNNRPDSFFEKEKRPKNDSESTESESTEIDLKEPEDSPIKDLKSVILSLEWEITAPVMQKLGEEIRKLERRFNQDKITIAFLQLLGSLGNYIRKKLAEAHPDSIRLLHSVYEQLELVVLSKNLSDAEKKKMLVAQVYHYKTLKEEILISKEAAGQSEKKTETPGQPGEAQEAAPACESRNESPDNRLSFDTGALPAGDLTAMGQEILNAMEEVRKTIQIEFSELRAELKRWRETR